MKENITYSPELRYFFDMWHRAADLNDADARSGLAGHLFDIWHRATNLNDADAQFDLASVLLKSTQKTAIKKAFALFKKLAHQSYTLTQTDAQFMLGKCYENGYGIQKSYPRAIRWYDMAAKNISNDLINNPDPKGEAAGKAVSEVFKASAIEGRDIDEVLDEIIFGKITPESIADVTEAANGGNVEAQIYLMKLYEYGGGYISEDREEYACWAQRAAENGNTEAMCDVGLMYYYGRDMEQDYETALYWLEKAAKQGSAFSAYQLGEYYKSQKRYKEAVKWYRKYSGLRIKERNGRLGWKMVRRWIILPDLQR